MKRPLTHRAGTPGLLGVVLVGLASCERDLDSSAKAFVANCAACHGPEGRGVERAGPPFVGSSWVDGPESRLVRIVLNGVGGAIDVSGKAYNLEMPGFGMALNDAQVAQLLTYLRQRFGSNPAPISTATVRRIRAETQGRERYWTAAELLELR